MSLDEWLIQEDMSEYEFADLIGRSQSAVSRYCHGLRMPDRKTMLRIIEVTRGEVSAKDMGCCAACGSPMHAAAG